ncbi:hypothetical protein GPECTOR_19g227 [Gonium pectorale]|uniref:Uncharacterized protein n=1 Tax=Gonium pectorale TaxID=33097 RepID=A0A150GJ12_GONPE|nr:hypothetical protein GPECTOR_19g227 [Gonium pectorale]|eukprot:KXZ49776.1 hypothetical protein GPECTOR_19g227 [Gonium pectorale]
MSPQSNRFNIVAQTYADTETLALYFTKAKPGVIANTDVIAPGVWADYDAAGKLVSLDIRSAPRTTPCHFFDTAEVVAGKQPLAVNWHYSAAHTRLVVLLGAWDTGIVTNTVETDDPNVSLGMDADGKLCAIFIANPACSTFTLA